MKDTTLRDDDDHDTIDCPCAQPICRHSCDDHRDGTGADTNCRLSCSAYVSRSRMFGRRVFWAVVSSGWRPRNLRPAHPKRGHPTPRGRWTFPAAQLSALDDTRRVSREACCR
jgi:hypothetical protein